MPRYFFHLRRNGRLESDPDGVQCPSVHAARREAMRTAREIISRDALTGQRTADYVFEIENEDGEMIALIPFSQTIGA